jgi:hypothetical protein
MTSLRPAPGTSRPGASRTSAREDAVRAAWVAATEASVGVVRIADEAVLARCASRADPDRAGI